MHRIDANGHVANLFVNGNPGIGQVATQCDADWLNAVQQGICYAIEQAAIPLVKGNNTQLYAAMLAIAAGVVGSGGGAVPTTRQVLGGGLVTGGGALSADRTLTVTAAAGSDLLTGTDNTKAATALAMANAFGGAGLTTNGYEKMPGGRIMQWGQVRGTFAEGSLPVSWPITFPTAVYAMIAMPWNTPGNILYDTLIQGVSATLSGGNFMVNHIPGSTNLSNGYDFLVIGK